MEGRTVREWQLGSVVSQTATSVTYRARHIHLRGDYVIEVLKAELSHDTVAFQRIVREAAVLATLRHEHIVAADSPFVDAGQIFLPLEHVPGRSLADALREKPGPWPIADALAVASQMAGALGAAHAQGALHRDVSPSAIIVADGPGPIRCKLAGFGLAKPEGAEAMTSFGAVLGTPAYLAPEVLRGSRTGPPADVFSLALVLYRMLAGRLPYDGVDDDSPVWTVIPAAIQAFAMGLAPPSRFVSLPAGLEGLLLACLSENPALRPANGAAFADSLRAVAGGAPIVAPSVPLAAPVPIPAPVHEPSIVSAVTLSAIPVPQAPAPPSDEPSLTSAVTLDRVPIVVPASPPKPRSWHPAAKLAAAAGLVALLVLAWQLTGPPPPPSEPAPVLPSGAPEQPNAAPVAPAPAPALPPGPGALGPGLPLLPPTVIAVASFSSLDAVTLDVIRLVAAAGVTLPGGRPELLEFLHRELGTTTLDWLDTTRPAHLVFLNSTLAADPIMVLPSKSAEAFPAALPTGFAVGESGNAYAWPGGGERLFGNLVGSVVIVGNSPTAFSAEPLAFAALASFIPSAEIDIRLALTQWRAAAPTDVAGWRARIETITGRVRGWFDPPFPGSRALSALAARLASAVDRCADDTEGVGLAVTVGDDDSITLALTFRPTPGTLLEGFAARAGSAELPGLESAPANAYLRIGSALLPEITASFVHGTLEAIAAVGNIPAASQTALIADLDALTALAMGPGWLAFFPDGGTPAAAVGAFGAAAEYRARMAGAGQTLFKQLLALGSGSTRPEWLAAETLADLFVLTNPSSSPNGLTLEAGWLESAGAATWRLGVTLDLERIGAQLANDPSGRALVGLFGARHETALSFAEGRVGIGFGSHGVANAAAAARGTLPPVTARLPKGTSFAMEVDLGRAVSGWRPLHPALGADALVWPAIPEGTILGVTLGADAGVVRVTAHGKGLPGLVKTALGRTP